MAMGQTTTPRPALAMSEPSLPTCCRAAALAERRAIVRMLRRWAIDAKCLESIDDYCGIRAYTYNLISDSVAVERAAADRRRRKRG